MVDGKYANAHSDSYDGVSLNLYTAKYFKDLVHDNPERVLDLTRMISDVSQAVLEKLYKFGNSL